MSDDFFSGLNESQAGVPWLSKFLGNHACTVLSQKIDRTQDKQLPRVQWFLRIENSTNPSLPKGAEVVHSQVKFSKKGESAFLAGIKKMIAALEGVDPMSSDFNFEAKVKEGEGLKYAGTKIGFMVVDNNRKTRDGAPIYDVLPVKVSK